MESELCNLKMLVDRMILETSLTINLQYIEGIHRQSYTCPSLRNVPTQKQWKWESNTKDSWKYLTQPVT